MSELVEEMILMTIVNLFYCAVDESRGGTAKRLTELVPKGSRYRIEFCIRIDDELYERMIREDNGRGTGAVLLSKGTRR